MYVSGDFCHKLPQKLNHGKAITRCFTDPYPPFGHSSSGVCGNMVSHDIIGTGTSERVFQCLTKCHCFPCVGLQKVTYWHSYTLSQKRRETSAASAAQVAKAVSRAKWEWSVHVKVAQEPLQVQGHILLTRATKTHTMHVKAPTGDPTENGDALLCSFE